MGTPESAVAPLGYLLENAAANDYQVLAVVTQAPKLQGRGKKKKLCDPPVAVFAKSKNISCLQPLKASDEEFLLALEKLGPDVIITCAYGQILSSRFLEIPQRATINIHPSALPKYRGATPVPAALLAGDPVTAVSILFTVKALDAGAIILQKEFAIGDDEICDALTMRLFKEAGPMLLEAFKKLDNLDFRGTPQDETSVSLCHKITKDLGLINWTKDSKTIYNQFRAYNSWPGSYSYMDSKRVLFEEMQRNDAECIANLKLKLASLEKKPKPGSCFFDKKRNLIAVKSQDDWLFVSRLKPAGSKSVDAISFWNGLVGSSDETRFFS